MGDINIPQNMQSDWVKQTVQKPKISMQDYQKLMQIANENDSKVDKTELKFLQDVVTKVDFAQGTKVEPYAFVDVQADDGSVQKLPVPTLLAPRWLNELQDGFSTKDFDAVVQESQSLQSKLVNKAGFGSVNDENYKFLMTMKGLLSGGNEEKKAEVPKELPPVPTNLKAAWSKIESKGSVSAEDYKALVGIAAPTGKDTEIDKAEEPFLYFIMSKLEANNWEPVSLGNKKPVETAKTTKTNKAEDLVPLNELVLTDWNAYTDQTKADFQKAYTGLVKNNVLDASAGNKIANAFGQKNISDLQKFIGAQEVTGKFTQETYYSAKKYIDYQVDKTSDKGRLEGLKNLMLQTLGRDDNILAKIDAKLGISSTANTATKTEIPKDANGRRTEIALSLLNKAGIDVGSNFKIENVKDGQVKISGQNFSLEIVDHIAERPNGMIDSFVDWFTTDPDETGDLQIKGTFNGKQVDVSYWENEARGDSAIKANGRYHLTSKIGTTKKDYVSNTGFTPMPLEAVTFKQQTPEAKDLTRINATKLLLNQLQSKGIINSANLENCKIYYPNSPEKFGDVKIIGNGVDLVIFDNIQTGRDAERNGDLRIKGTVGGQDIDATYWENSRRGETSKTKFGLYYLGTTVDGKKNEIKSNTPLLPVDLITVRK